MNKQEIERLWKIATNDPNHDTNWHDPVVVKFAELVEFSLMDKLLTNPSLCRQIIDAGLLASHPGGLRQRGTKTIGESECDH